LETAEVSLPEKMLVFALDYWTMSLEYPAWPKSQSCRNFFWKATRMRSGSPDA
jgi:hypothetical protein